MAGHKFAKNLAGQNCPYDIQIKDESQGIGRQVEERLIGTGRSTGVVPAGRVDQAVYLPKGFDHLAGTLLQDLRVKYVTVNDDGPTDAGFKTFHQTVGESRVAVHDGNTGATPYQGTSYLAA